MGVAAVTRQMILVAAEAENRFRGQMAATIFRAGEDRGRSSPSDKRRRREASFRASSLNQGSTLPLRTTSPHSVDNPDTNPLHAKLVFWLKMY